MDGQWSVVSRGFKLEVQHGDLKAFGRFQVSQGP